MKQATSFAGVVPPPELVTLARDYADDHGVVTAARVFGVSRQSLTSLLAGLRVRRGTIVLVARALHWAESDSPSLPPAAA